MSGGLFPHNPSSIVIYIIYYSSISQLHPMRLGILLIHQDTVNLCEIRHHT